MKTNDIGRDRIVSDLKRIALDSEALLRDSADLVGDKAADMRARLEDVATRARTSCQLLQDRAEDRLAATDKAIRERPYQSLGVAAAAGLVLGVLIMRR